MLKGIDPVLSPDLLHALASMGHGDTLVIADANFPAATLARRLCHAHGLSALRVLKAVLSVMPLDTFVSQPVAVMQVVGKPLAVSEPVTEFQTLVDEVQGRAEKFEVVERHAFYDRARSAFAIVITGESRPYGNIILAKGGIRAS